jgi:hypothetical protein
MKQPYKINIDPTILDDLKARIANARWTDEIEKAKWETGTNEIYLKELCSYWKDNPEENAAVDSDRKRVCIHPKHKAPIAGVWP